MTIEDELEYECREPTCVECGRLLDREEWEIWGDFCEKCVEQTKGNQ